MYEHLKHFMKSRISNSTKKAEQQIGETNTITGISL